MSSWKFKRVVRRKAKPRLQPTSDAMSMTFLPRVGPRAGLGAASGGLPGLGGLSGPEALQGGSTARRLGASASAFFRNR
jgi:hypothetical protein